MNAARVPRIVARVEALTAIIRELSAAAINAVFSKSRLYQSRVNPFQAKEYLELLKEKTATTTRGRYKNR